MVFLLAKQRAAATQEPVFLDEEGQLFGSWITKSWFHISSSSEQAKVWGKKKKNNYKLQ